jgi:hypothetical protein
MDDRVDPGQHHLAARSRRLRRAGERRDKSEHEERTADTGERRGRHGVGFIIED